MMGQVLSVIERDGGCFRVAKKKREKRERTLI